MTLRSTADRVAYNAGALQFLTEAVTNLTAIKASTAALTSDQKDQLQAVIDHFTPREALYVDFVNAPVDYDPINLAGNVPPTK